MRKSIKTLMIIIISGCPKYRLAVPSDAPELLKLNDLFNGEGCNSLTGIEASLKDNSQEIVCVAADGETLIGFCCGQIIMSMCYDANYGEITELFVVESHRRQGVASGLMSFIESEFLNHGINYFQLFTGGENKTGQAFYREQGYKATTEIMFRKRPQNGETKND
jgi:ribosomal protein S18 acetylase RimI-like enzyme